MVAEEYLSTLNLNFESNLILLQVIFIAYFTSNFIIKFVTQIVVLQDLALIIKSHPKLATGQNVCLFTPASVK